VSEPVPGLPAAKSTTARLPAVVPLVRGISALKWWFDCETQSAVA
jgi:hypothetical protein